MKSPDGTPGSLAALDWYCHFRRCKGDKNVGTWLDTAAVLAYYKNQPVSPFAFNFERWVVLFKRFYNRCFGSYMWDDSYQREIFWQPAEVIADCGQPYYGLSEDDLRHFWRSGATPSQAAREAYEAGQSAELYDYIDYSREATAWNNYAATGDPNVSVDQYYASERMGDKSEWW